MIKRIIQLFFVELDDDFVDDVTRIHKMLMDNDDFSEKFELPEQLRFLMHLIGHHMCALQYSDVKVAAGMNDGTSVYPIVGTFFRHSCVPNVALVTSDQSVIAVTIRPILSKEELTVSYLSDDALDNITFVRKMILREEYNFRCKCERCASGTGMFGSSRNTSSILPQQFKDDIENESHFHHKMQKMRRKLTNECLKYLDASGRLQRNEDISLAINTYVRLLREKYYLNIHY